MTPFSETLRHVARLPGVTLAMTVGAADGLIVEVGLGGAGAADSGQSAHRHVAALGAYLYARAGRASAAAGLGEPAFMRLEAARGQLCVAGAGDLVLLAVLERDANLGRTRLDMLAGVRSGT